MTHPALIERITRSLAYMLRHQPEQFDLELDEYGYAQIDDVVQALNERLGEAVEEEDVQAAITSGDRVRYEINSGRIRALYGHSIEVKPGEPSRPPALLFVGVSSADAERAQRFGLRAGRRRFLHLALSPEDALETGRRSARDYVVITVNALDAWDEGINFYDRKSLFLSDPIPSQFLEVGDLHSDGYGEEGAGREFGRSDGGRRREGRRDDRHPGDRHSADRHPGDRPGRSFERGAPPGARPQPAGMHAEVPEHAEPKVHEAEARPQFARDEGSPDSALPAAGPDSGPREHGGRRRRRRGGHGRHEEMHAGEPHARGPDDAPHAQRPAHDDVVQAHRPVHEDAPRGPRHGHDDAPRGPRHGHEDVAHGPRHGQEDAAHGPRHGPDDRRGMQRPSEPMRGGEHRDRPGRPPGDDRRDFQRSPGGDRPRSFEPQRDSRRDDRGGHRRGDERRAPAHSVPSSSHSPGSRPAERSAPVERPSTPERPSAAEQGDFGTGIFEGGAAKRPQRERAPVPPPRETRERPREPKPETPDDSGFGAGI
jgi:putative RNA 2'-phosphotransferase